MISELSPRLTKLMEQAVAYSREHVNGGGIPFTALVVNSNGAVLGRGVNRVCAHHDPTAHAEVEAIRDACRTQATPHLHGAILLASGEPCAMCYLNALYAGISQVYYAVDRDEAAAHGFDYRGTYRVFADDPHRWQTPAVERLAVPDRLRPFLEFSSMRRTL